MLGIQSSLGHYLPEEVLGRVVVIRQLVDLGHFTEITYSFFFFFFDRQPCLHSRNSLKRIMLLPDLFL